MQAPPLTPSSTPLSLLPRRTDGAMASLLLPRSLPLHWSRSGLQPFVSGRPSSLRFARGPAFVRFTASFPTDADGRSTEPVSLVTGASGGLGLEFTRQLLSKYPGSQVVATCRNPDSSESLTNLKRLNQARLTVLPLDVTEEHSVEAAAQEISNKFKRLDLVVNAAGILQIPDVLQPETALDKVDPENLLLAYKVNAIGPIIVTKHMWPLLKLGMGEGSGRAAAVVANISAKVGSIRDNKLGGWYAYRASKSALNQLTKTAAVEALRRKDPVICILLHPGTVDTNLSKPYSRNVPQGKLFTTDYAVERLLGIINKVKMEDNGKFFSWDRQEVPW